MKIEIQNILRTTYDYCLCCPGSIDRVEGVIKKGSRFQAQIRHFGNLFYLGSFKTAKEAADAYDAKAKKLFGTFYHPSNS